MSDEQKISEETVKGFLGSGEEKDSSSQFKNYDAMKLNESKDEFEREFLIRKLEEN